MRIICLLRVELFICALRTTNIILFDAQYMHWYEYDVVYFADCSPLMCEEYAHVEYSMNSMCDCEMYHSGGGGEAGGGGVDRRGRRGRVLADGDGDGAGGGAAAAEAARYRARARRLERVERLHRARQRLQQLRDAVRLGRQTDQTEERLLQLLRAMFLCSHAHAAVVHVSCVACCC